jgi:hypothetical protein
MKRTEAFIRYSSFVMDVYNKCQAGGNFGMYKLINHHNVSRNSSLKALMQSGRLIATKTHNNNVWQWFGSAPTTNDIIEIYAKKREIETMANQNLKAKSEAIIDDIVEEFESQKPTIGRPRIHPVGERGAARGCKRNETRVTTIMDKDLLDNVRRLAYWDRRKFKDVVTLALEKHIASYVAYNGPLAEIPEQ